MIGRVISVVRLKRVCISSTLLAPLPMLSALAQPCMRPACALILPADAGALNVRDFGAKGDGVADDTAAFVAAATASGGDTGETWWHDRIIRVPGGTYRVTDSIVKRYRDGSFGSGLSLLGEGTRPHHHPAGRPFSGFPGSVVSARRRDDDVQTARFRR